MKQALTDVLAIFLAKHIHIFIFYCECFQGIVVDAIT